MKVVWTEAALVDLDDILAYAAENYPAVVAPLEQRVRAMVNRHIHHAARDEASPLDEGRQEPP